MKSNIKTIFSIEKGKRIKLPFYEIPVPAGFPSPADDYIEDRLDFNEKFVEHPEATYFVRVAGDSMINARIYDGDLVMIDCAIEHRNGSIVLAAIDGEVVLKRYVIEKGKHILRSENPDYGDIILSENSSFKVWGVLKLVIIDRIE